MSYAAVRSPSIAFGPPAVGLFASGSVVCTGDVFDRAGNCCPDREWHNIVYLGVKGALSLRYHNEKRVRHALNLLSAAHLEDVRWRAEGDLDQPVVLEPRFVRGATRAARNYHALYPEGRWYRVKDAIAAIRTPQATCGPFDAWAAENAPHTPEWQRASSAVGAGPDPGGTLIATVPGSSPDAERQTMPRDGELFEVRGGALGPTAWTAALLDRFAPSWRGLKLPRSGMLRVKHEPEPLTLSARALRRYVETEEPAPEGPPWLLIGLGVAAVATAGGYYYYRTAR